eukprot:GHRR01024221.1.p1 GENE.GHRR01024221.1~~GHRR01024221.1.p1  ORF type:complete len:203 (+),score=60.15 GHRR01024221.1:211-819(+)
MKALTKAGSPTAGTKTPMTAFAGGCIPVLKIQCAGAAAARARMVRVCAYKHSGPLRGIQETRARHLLSTYNKAYPFFPNVKFILKHNSRQGEVWKVTGNCPELGNWVPELAPSLSWNDGGVWSSETPLPPGTYSFKCVLRCADGTYIWEEGENRHLVVSSRHWDGSVLHPSSQAEHATINHKHSVMTVQNMLRTPAQQHKTC